MQGDDNNRWQDIKDDVEDLKRTLYGNNDYKGLRIRLEILEDRLKLFWWALAVVGSTALALLVQIIFKHVAG